MIPQIPTWQRIFQRFLMSRPVTVLVAPILHHADAILLKLTGGRLDFTRASGLPIVKLTTIGAKSGQTRTIPLAGFPDGDKVVLVASNFGRAHHPGWYYNLKSNPECMVKKEKFTGAYIAREAHGEERKHYWDLANSYYRGYEVYKQRAANRKIPVMLLEPKG